MASRPSPPVGLVGRAVGVRMRKMRMRRKMMRKMMRRMMRRKMTRRMRAVMVRREVMKNKLLLMQIILERENWTLGRILQRE